MLGTTVVPSIKRTLDLPFCQACWKRVEIARRVKLVAIPVAVITLFVGLVLKAATDAYAPFLIALALGAAVLGGAWAHARSTLPRYSSRGRKGLDIDVPGVGVVSIPGSEE
jgi:MFS-type transporter involved in bile tolerance (Atg22 family)